MMVWTVVSRETFGGHMPNWADDNTGRIICKVKMAGHVHYTKGRIPTGASQTLIDDAQARIAGAYHQFDEYLPSDFACLAVKFIPGNQISGVDQELSSIWGDIVGEKFPDPYQTAKYINFVGTGVGKGTCSIKLWGMSFVATASADDDFRRTPGELAAVAAAKTILDGLNPLFVLRNGQQAVFGSSALSRVAAYWQTKLRA
jgi:hypothetical protein